MSWLGLGRAPKPYQTRMDTNANGHTEWCGDCACHENHCTCREVTEGMVEKAAKALFWESYGEGWDEAQGSYDVEVCVSNARAALTAALGVSG